MRGLVLFYLALVLGLCQCHAVVAQRMSRLKPDKPVICHYSPESRHDHVGVSERFKQLRETSAGRVKSATFEVEYINFPADGLARTAFQYAVEIWESELVSSIPIRIRAEWSSLEKGVLGQALWGSAYSNFGGEQHMNTFYPVALAEKIAGRELNPPGEPDIVASFNSNIEWYFGEDGKTPAGEMDLVTIVLHEIAHGLGFTHTYTVEGLQGSVGFPSGAVLVPLIFDVFVEDSSGENLLHDFESPSKPLANALQSNDVFFNSPMSVAALEGVKPELFAPTAFDAGSSIAHLDESTFNGILDANRLMTPQIAFAESIHNPGDVLLAMFSDMGWVYTRIDHEPLKDTERMDGQPYIVSTFIRSDNGYDPASVKLHYTTDGVNFTIVDMTPTGVGDQFEASVPGRTGNWAYAYFISVRDIENRAFTSPGKIQESGNQPAQATHFFNIGPDVTPPEIIHEPIVYIFQDDVALEVTAEVTDNLGVGEVVLEYFMNNGPLQTLVMDKIALTDEYAASIVLPALAVGDKLEYRILATDLASAANAAQLPVEGFFTATVTGTMPLQDSYINNFNEPSNDFFGYSFSITTPPGFEDGAIHSDHPYQNGTGPNDESNYTYQLQVPVRIGNANPVIKFDEIVLVEPGEEGSTFGDNSFYDYVIVEGSTDNGVSWKPFAPGYDSRHRDVWLSRYNANVINANSQAEGQPGLYHERVIDMLENENFAAGDEVLIRFRLFADQLAHGWGWAIDNLSVQPPVTSLEQPPSSQLQVFPVPVQNELFISFAHPREAVRYEVSDLQGRVLLETGSVAPGITLTSINVRSLKQGIYILKTVSSGKVYTRKFLKSSAD